MPVTHEAVERVEQAWEDGLISTVSIFERMKQPNNNWEDLAHKVDQSQAILVLAFLEEALVELLPDSSLSSILTVRARLFLVDPPRGLINVEVSGLTAEEKQKLTAAYRDLEETQANVENEVDEDTLTLLPLLKRFVDKLSLPG